MNGHGGTRAGSGRKPKATFERVLADPVHYETALAWAMDRINDPAVPVELKAKICAAVLPFQERRIEAHRVGLKELQAEAARTAGIGTEWERLLHPEPPPALVKKHEPEAAKDTPDDVFKPARPPKLQ